MNFATHKIRLLLRVVAIDLPKQKIAAMYKSNKGGAAYFSDEFLLEIGSRLRRVRVLQGTKLDTVVAMTGFSEAMISKIENGKYKSLKVTLLYALTEFYGIEVAEVIPSKTEIVRKVEGQFSLKNSN